MIVIIYCKTIIALPHLTVQVKEGQILTMNIIPVLGAGFKILNREAIQVDLGALGEETIAALSQEYFALFAGMQLAKKISGILSFFVEPGFAFYDLNALNRSFSIKGGINVQFD